MNAPPPIHARLSVRATRADIRRVVGMIPGLLSGKIPDPSGLVEGICLRAGMTALALIKTAFLVKAAGGTDECGDKWPPLAPSTIARRRLGPADRKALTLRERLGKLSDAERKKVKREIADRRAEYLVRGLDVKQANALARAQAFGGARRRGGSIETRAKILGTRIVEILRDTDLLYGSLTIGAPLNVFEMQPGKVIVGSNRPHVDVHHEGKGHVPQRRIWPDPSHWPESWWAQIRAEVSKGIVKLVHWMLMNAGKVTGGDVSLPESEVAR